MLTVPPVNSRPAPPPPQAKHKWFATTDWEALLQVRTPPGIVGRAVGGSRPQNPLFVRKNTLSLP
jgi:hypothetical protein